MTITEIWRRLPDTINHPTQGYAELEIIVDKLNDKGICYRHRNNSASYGNYGSTWNEVFNKLGPFMVERGYIVED
jgi:hypothetical protein